MKKIATGIAVLLLFSILLSGCTQQNIGSGITQNNGPAPEMSAELTQDQLWMQKAIEEKNENYCDNIGDQAQREECYYNMIPLRVDG